MSERTEQLLEQMIVQLDRIGREQKTMRELMSKFVNFMADAESEMPEWYRRFTNGMHDVHDIKYMYEDVGTIVPNHILRECERLDDRFRQVLDRMNAQGGAFEKIRREMASDPLNRWDHTRLLPKPEEIIDETGTSE
jgi:hypothetical protein